MRATGLGAGTTQTFAAKWLHAHHRADLVAVDVDIAHMGGSRQRLCAAVDAGLDADGQAVTQRVANVYANELRLGEMAEIGVAENELNKLLVLKGDLLVVEGNGSPDQIGRVAMWDGLIDPCVHQNHLIKVRVAMAPPTWVLNWLLSPGGRTQIELVSSSTTGLHTLSTGKIGNLPVPLPPLAEQHRIVAEIDRRLSLVHGVEREIDANLKRAQAMRQSVLHSAFTTAGASETIRPS